MLGVSVYRDFRWAWDRSTKGRRKGAWGMSLGYLEIIFIPPHVFQSMVDNETARG